MLALSLQSGETALHVAARYGHVDVVQYLCSIGSNPNFQDKVGSISSSSSYRNVSSFSISNHNFWSCLIAPCHVSNRNYFGVLPPSKWRLFINCVHEKATFFPCRTPRYLEMIYRSLRMERAAPLFTQQKCKLCATLMGSASTWTGY